MDAMATEEESELEAAAFWDSSQHDYVPSLQALPAFSARIVAYIAVWIVHKLRKRTLLCEECYEMLYISREGNNKSFEALIFNDVFPLH